MTFASRYFGRIVPFAATAVIAVCVQGCEEPDPCLETPIAELDCWDDAEKAAIAQFALPETLPASPTNKYADLEPAAKLGQKFFFEKRFSGKQGKAGSTTSPTTYHPAVAAAVGAEGTAAITNCATCHSGHAGDDRKTPNHVAIGTGIHPRHSPPVLNSSHLDWTNWAGRFRKPWELPIPVYENGAILNGSRMYLAQKILELYKDEYNAVFTDFKLGTGAGEFNPNAPASCAMGDTCLLTVDTIAQGKAGTAMAPTVFDRLSADDKGKYTRVLVNYSKALDAYMRKLVAGNSKLDQYIAAGLKGPALSASQKRGLELFIGGAACTQCHKGPMMGGEQFHNTGLRHVLATDDPPSPKRNDAMPPVALDEGRITDVKGLTGATAINVAHATYSDDVAAGTALMAGVAFDMAGTQRGQFRDAPLRNIADTPPYMHAGQLKTLEEVVAFYNRGGDPDGFDGAKDPLMKPLGLNATAEADLVEFMKALSGDQAPAEWTNSPL